MACEVIDLKKSGYRPGNGVNYAILKKKKHR